MLSPCIVNLNDISSAVSTSLTPLFITLAAGIIVRPNAYCEFNSGASTAKISGSKFIAVLNK